MKNLKLYLASAACALAVSVSAQTTTANVAPTSTVTPSLTDAEVSNLLSKIGSSDKWVDEHHGLYLSDTMASLMSVADNTGNSPSGMSVDVYTPQAWIVEQAFLAQEKMMPFTMKDVTPDMRRNVIRVVGHPSTPVNLTANGMGYASNVTHVVLRYTKKSAVIQPETETPTNQTIQSAVGSPIVMHGQVAEFSLADLAAARGPSGGGEFFVTLLGDNPIAARKDFKVKSKDFSKLIGQ